MKKLLLGMGYLTWIVCNISVVYGIGLAAFKLIESKSLGEFLLGLSVGLVILIMLIVLSILSLAMVAMLFGDEKLEKKVEDSIPNFLK